MIGDFIFVVAFVISIAMFMLGELTKVKAKIKEEQEHRNWSEMLCDCPVHLPEPEPEPQEELHKVITNALRASD